MSLRPWQDRIQDMLDAIAEIASFVAGMSFDQFQSDAKTLKAVVADLGIIGEAARHVPDDIANAYPEVPWPLMSGMRNRIIHAYFDVDAQVVWDTCQQDLPQLVGTLQGILQNHPAH